MMGRLEAIKQVFLAYFKAELIRSHGLVIGILSLSVWLSLFIAPLLLFKPPGVPPERISGLALTAVMIFIAYSVATWDWAWELRWLMFHGVLEHVIVSGNSVFLLYAGVIPVSLLWYSVSVCASALLLATFLGPPAISVADPVALLIAVLTMVVVLLAYAMLLGATTIGVGSAGPVLELVGFILPIATGGLVPLSYMPKALQTLALVTPFSYPAELIRYSLGVSNTVLPLWETEAIGAAYSVIFLLVAYALFRVQLKRLLKEGIRTVSMW